MSYIRSYKNQNYLIPPNITDLFSKNHICYLVEQIADEMDYSDFDKKYAGAGHPAYHPRIIIKLLLMGHVDGIRSSRRIAKNAQENVVYIYLAEKTQPDFRTISDFRKDNKTLVKNVFRKVNVFALEQGLIDLSHLSIDGTTIKANANNDKVIEPENLKKLEKYIEQCIEKGIKVDEEEDKLYGNRGMHELPEDLHDPKKRRPIVKKIVDEINEAMKKDDKEKVKQIKKELHNVKNLIEEEDVKKLSLTDKSARFMLNKKGKVELSYNAQLVVEKNGLIISNDVVQDCDDRHQLRPNVARTEQDIGQLPEGTKLSTDGLYLNGEDIQTLDTRGFDIYMPMYGMVKDMKNKFDKVNFQYDEEQDAYICPENKLLQNVGSYFSKNRNERLTIYKGEINDCQACPVSQACCKNAKRRAIHALPQDKLFNRIKEKMQTEEGKEVYALRKQTVERSFGDMKHNKGFRNFLLRGIEKVKIEFDLSCIAHNLVMIHNLLQKKRTTSPATC